MSPSRCRSLAGLAAGCLALTACAQVGEPGVDVQALQADVAFGVDLPVEEDPLELPTVGVPEVIPEEPFDDGSVVIPFRNRLPERFQNVAFRAPAPEPVECPSAPIGASPDMAAPEGVDTKPQEGLTDWKRKLELVQHVGEIDIPFRVEGFESRILRGVEEISADDDGMIFEYETIRPNGFGLVQIERFRVNTNPVQQGANNNVDPRGAVEGVEERGKEEGVPGDLPDDVTGEIPNQGRVRVGEPNRGIVLIEQVLFDGNGQQVGAFQPSSPVLLLPLPVEPGDSWSSTGVDPRTGQTMVVDGFINERETVDACGTLLDAWRSELDVQVASGASNATQFRELLISTERGAVLIGERLHEEGTDSQGRSFTLDAEWGLADVEIAPLPEGTEDSA